MGHLAFETVNLAALLLMGAGFFWKDRRCHILRALGWTLLGVHWVIKAPDYFAHDDAVNGLGAALALPIFLFMAYHETRSYKWNDDYPPLRFVVGAVFIAGMGYFIIGNIALVEKVLIRIIADQSVAFANLLGHNFEAGPVLFNEEFGGYASYISNTGVWIILECTAIQAFLVAGSFLFGCRGDRARRMKTFLLIAPVVYIVNLFRNALVLIFVHGGMDFDFAHNYIGKTLSLVTLIILIIIAFIIVPELYEDINGLFELPWRRGPKHDYLKFVGRLFSKKDEEKEEDKDEPAEEEVPAEEELPVEGLPVEEGEVPSGETPISQNKPET